MSATSVRDVVVFVGPTLASAEAASLLQATYMPPAAQGDVYRAALAKPWAIAIIDGYFERVPAVWHKEILWALSRGIHVFGAASMGALRAAELAPFGMVGVGRIFAAYRTGEWMDDDEVTIVHAHQSQGYRAHSVAMADIRATLDRAREQHVVSAETSERLVALAKALYYPERCYARLWVEARATALPAVELERVEAWSQQNQVHQKAADARELLEHIAKLRAEQAGPKPVNFHFEHTDAFEQLVQAERAGTRAAASGNAVLDELRLEPELFREVAGRAFARVLAAQLAERFQIEADEAAYRREVEAYRRERDLLDAAATEAFLARQELTRAALAELLRADVRAQRLHAAIGDDVERAMLDVLKLDGRFERLARAGQDKQAWLEARGQAHASTEALNEAAIVCWYAERVAPRAGRTKDQQQLLSSLHFRDAYQLLAAARRQYLYETTRHVHEAEESTDEEAHVHRGLEARFAELGCADLQADPGGSEAGRRQEAGSGGT